MQWTSLEAYWSIFDDLPRRRQQTLALLLAYVSHRKVVPTGQELEQYCKDRGLSDVAQPNYFKRLSELADLANAVHRTEARPCSVTGNLALTWTPGPLPGTELGTPQPDRLLQKRLERLKKHAPDINFEDARFVLNVTEQKLSDLWDWKGGDEILL